MSVAYPSSPQVFPSDRLRAPSGSTAETLILAGLVLQIIGALVLFGAVAWLFGFSILNPYPYAWLAVSAAVTVGAAAALFLYLVYAYAYQPAFRGDYVAAQGPTLVFGILGLIFGLLPGLLYLIAYAKLGDALREQQSLAHPQMGWPAMFPPAAPLACVGCGRVFPMGQFAYCPGCGHKLGA